MKKSKELLQKIAENLQLGNTLTSICKSKDMPNLATIYKWMDKDKELKETITEARRIGAMTWLDKCQDLLDRETPPQEVMLLRERLNHGRWLASKLIAVFGDKQTITNVGDPVIKIVWDDGSLKDKGKASTHAVRGSTLDQELDNTKENKGNKPLIN